MEKKAIVKKIGVWAGLFVAVIGLVVSGYSLGVWVGETHSKTIIVHGATNVSDENAPANFNLFWEAWDVVSKNYLKDGDINAQEKVYGSISGLVGSLDDPYSEFFPPTENKQFQENIQGNFGGIGAEIGTRDNRLLVITPLKDTPAMRVGLEPDDWIIKVDATSTESLNVQEAVQIIRGPIGTEVTLTIVREGWDEPKEFKVTREQIVIPTLDSEMKEGNIAYIQLYSFNGNTDSLFRSAVYKAFGSGARGIVLDLRNNPGGYLQVAINMAGWFLPRGSVVTSEEGRQGITQEFRTTGNAALHEIPIVLIVNKGSASASEILAGALRDHRNVPIVGETTYGKGSIQRLEDLSDGSSIKITVAHWLLPKGSLIEGKGIDPDYKVEITDEDKEAKRDPQLEKALEVLKEEIEKKDPLIFFVL